MSPTKKSPGRRRKSERKKSVAIMYHRDGIMIRHIDMHADQLPKEIDRLTTVMKDVYRLITAPRLRAVHPIIEQVRYTLACAPAAFVAELSVAQMTQEIGRLNYLMNYALTVMGIMKSDYPILQQARFKLRYGQTSKKREAGWNSFKRDHETERYENREDYPDEKDDDYE